MCTSLRLSIYTRQYFIMCPFYKRKVAYFSLYSPYCLYFWLSPIGAALHAVIVWRRRRRTPGQTCGALRSRLAGCKITLTTK